MTALLNELVCSVFSRNEGETPKAEEMETSNLENISTTTWKVRKKIRGRIPGRNGDKSLKSCYSQSPFYSPPPCAKVV